MIFIMLMTAGSGYITNTYYGLEFLLLHLHIVLLSYTYTTII